MNKIKQELKTSQVLALILSVMHFGVLLKAKVEVKKQKASKEALKIFSKNLSNFFQWAINNKNLVLQQLGKPKAKTSV